MFLRNPWQNITKKEIASLYLSDTSLGDTSSTIIAVKFQLRDTPEFTVTENKEIDKTSSV